MHDSHGFTWISTIPALHAFPMHVVTAVVVAVVLVATMIVASAQHMKYLKNSTGGLVPEKTVTFRNFFELVAENIFGLCETVMGRHEAAVYFPIVGTLFVFIFASNLLGLIPGFLPPTDNLNTTLALGTFVFIFYNYAGLKANGISYLKHFLGPLLWLSPLMLVIEIASHVFRPISLALRLRGNIMGDHVVLGIFSQLVPWLLPVVFYGLGLFVAFVQAFVFCLMTMVYISLSATHEEH